MSELIIYDSKNLPAEINEVLTALSSHFVKDMTDEDLYEYLRPLITKSFTDAGYNQPENIVYFITEVLNDVRQACKWQALRKDELSIAFYKGIRKEYGDYVGLPVVRFAEFITGYGKSQSRTQALAEKNKSFDVAAEPTEQEKFETAKQLALKAFKDVEQGMDINLYGRVVYDFLNGLGIIQLGKDQRWEFYEQAKEQIKRECQVKVAGSLDLPLIKRVQTQLKAIENNERDEKIIARSKCLALHYCIQTWIFESYDLGYLIDSVKPNF